MVTTLILTASVLLDIAPRGQNLLCEAREGVEIYVVEDMVDGPEIVAPYRVVEVIRGEEAETLVLGETLSRGVLVKSIGIRRIIYVKDGKILRACPTRSSDAKSPDRERYPSHTLRREVWSDVSARPLFDGTVSRLFDGLAGGDGVSRERFPQVA